MIIRGEYGVDVKSDDQVVKDHPLCSLIKYGGFTFMVTGYSASGSSVTGLWARQQMIDGRMGRLTRIALHEIDK